MPFPVHFLKRCHYWLGAIFFLWLLFPSYLSAGMPSPLPEDIATVFRLYEEPKQRLQAISFFVLGIFVCTLFVKLLWNTLAVDFINLPKITLTKSFTIVFMWGALFVIILTMISGARELMTPGAWKKEGITYKLSDSNDFDPTIEQGEAETKPETGID